MGSYILELSENSRHVHCSRGFVIVCEGDTEIGRMPIDCLVAAIISAEGATLAKSFFVRLGEANIPIIAVRLRVKKKVQNLNAMWYKEFAKNFATQGDFGHESP